MVTIETISIVFTGISISLAAFYYINTLRNTRKNQELQLETRQAQLLSNFSNILITNDSLWNDALYWWYQPKMEYEEFKERHPLESDGYNSLIRLFTFYEMVGLLSRRELVDVELVHELMAFHWDKFKPIVKGMQEEWGAKWMEHYEWLGEAWISILNETEFVKTPEPEG